MAEPAQPDLSAAMSPSGIKQEPNILDGLDLDSMLQAATKRPFDDTANGDDDPSKRVKTETEHAHNNTFETGHGDEESLEDGLALLVQNALNNVGDLVSQFTQDTELPQTTHDPMDIDTAPMSEPPLPPPTVTFSCDPQKYLRKASQHALGNMALSILLLFSQPFDDTIKPIQEAESHHAASFRNLQSSFEHIKQIYSTGPILSADDVELQDDEYRTILDLANLAQFAVWLLRDTPSYAEAHANFHSIFRGQVSDLGSDALDLYLSLKTQVAIDALATKSPEQQIEHVLDESLINGMEEKLCSLHGGSELTPSDLEFVASVRSRRASLESEAQFDSALLRLRFSVDDLLRQVGTCVKTRVALMSDLGSRLGHVMPSLEDTAVDLLGDTTGDADLDLDDLSSFFEKTTSGLVQNALAGLTDENPPPTPVEEIIEQPSEPAKSPEKADSSTPQTNGKVDLMTDYKELEALVAESTSNYVKTTLHGLSPVPYQPTVPTSTSELFVTHGKEPYPSVTNAPTAQSYLSQLQQAQAQHPYYSYTHSIPEPQPPPPEPGQNLPPNQTFPSAILYDKARQAALSKSSAHTRREGLHSTRRPWTQEEEKALMAGLDMVKGPHWSQILTLFGQNGTISDILKDRTQVQLKDKARNLKLFFLKTNSEMPYYLQAVTGELKTRAPTQAARKEAEERARMNSEEDQARIQGIMTLAGGLQNPPQGRTAGTPASAVGSGVITPAQAASAAQAASTQHGSPVQHQTAAHSYNPATSSGYPPSSLPQARSSMMTTTQQGLQSSPQGVRPQSQGNPQTPRPQHQPQQQPQSAMHSPAQAHAAAQARSHTSTPVGQLHHSSPAHHTPTPQSASTVPAQHAQHQHTHYSPPQHTQLTFPSPPASTSAQSMHLSAHAPMSELQSEMHDNAAEAALLQGLQAAVAESL
ncbi:hypothetical protein FZEAL_4390 [Fusarium zealandicum]|uniref:HTH myb-type domain-containing protein n=1 Tax=Fusarium zealandicum TaxID=1053134 RepID=A0A8H4XLH9_9HYPO|nr:hypothetical protein FZEAL_4390 [Fusarium zealandicum]